MGVKEGGGGMEVWTDLTWSLLIFIPNSTKRKDQRNNEIVVCFIRNDNLYVNFVQTYRQMRLRQVEWTLIGRLLPGRRPAETTQHCDTTVL